MSRQPEPEQHHEAARLEETSVCRDQLEHVLLRTSSHERLTKVVSVLKEHTAEYTCVSYLCIYIYTYTEEEAVLQKYTYVSLRTHRQIV